MDTKQLQGLMEAYSQVYTPQKVEEGFEDILSISDEELIEICEEVIYEMIDEGYDLTDCDFLSESENLDEAMGRVKSALSSALKKVGGKMSKAGSVGSYRMVRRGGKLVQPKREKVKKAIGKLGRKLVSAGERLSPAEKEKPAERKTTKALPGTAARKALPPAKDTETTTAPKVKRTTVSLPASPERKALPARGTTKKGKPLTQSQRQMQLDMKNKKLAARLGEEVDVFDIVLEHLIENGYAETQEAAEAIMVNMSEGWRDEILEAMTPAQIEKIAKKAAGKPTTKSGKKLPAGMRE